MRKTAIILVAVLLLSLTACVTAVQNYGTPANHAVTPLIWRVTSPDGYILYLFGSPVLGRADIYPLPDIVMDAFHASDVLLMETNPLEELRWIDRQRLNDLLISDTTIADTLGHDILDIVRDRVLDPFYMSAMRGIFGPDFVTSPAFTFPMWFSVFGNINAYLAGFYAEYMVETHFLNLALEAYMTIIGTQTILDLFRSTYSISAELQLLLLEERLDTEAYVNSMIYLFEMIIRGDYEEILYTIMYAPDGADEELFREASETLIFGPNRIMAAAARAVLADKRNVFFVINAANLIGEMGIVNLLIQDGYSVERVTPR
ncbi:MAG: TraB/GumN family protein [Defluviitaleaceae bacterium]|nr:TraB/GumN family protein [Defluviitaleaceae bacterium]